MRRLHFSCRIARGSSRLARALAVTTAIAAAYPALGFTLEGTYAPATIDSDSLIVTDTALDIASMQSGNVLQRMAALRAGTRGLDLTGLNVQSGSRYITGTSLNAVSKPILEPVFDGVLSRGDESDRWGLFANGDVRRGPTAADNVGMTTGVDYRLGDHLAVGSSVGYTSLGIASQPDRTSLDVESRRVSLFGTYFRPNALHIDGLIAYGTNAYDSMRRIGTAAGIPAAIAKGVTRGSQLSGALTSAFDLQSGPLKFAPRLGAYFVDVDVDPIDEFGAGDLDLGVGNQNAQSLRLSAGARLSLALHLPWGVVTPNVNADYVHDASRSAAVELNYRADPFDRFAPSQVAAGAMNPGYLAWSVGASAQLARLISGFVDYRDTTAVDSVVPGELTWGLRFEAPLR